MARHQEVPVLTTPQRMMLEQVRSGRVQRRMSDRGWVWVLGGADAHGTDRNLINRLLDLRLLRTPAPVGARPPEIGEHESPEITELGDAALR